MKTLRRIISYLGSFANNYELTFLIYVKKLLGTMGTICKHIQKTKLFNLVHVEKWPKIFIGNHHSYGYMGRFFERF
jgi:hypothetical protein